MEQWLDAWTVYDRQGLPVDDPRLGDCVSTCTRFSIPEYTQETWQLQRERIREQILVACGLMPHMPRRKVNARVFDAMEIEGVIIEKVEFECVPGLMVTGNLYRPAGADGPMPAILNPHGHWLHGRVERTQLGDIPMRGVDFARMGMTALLYDMVGYCDSRSLAHRGRHPSEAAEELYGFSLVGLQTLSGLRAVDFLLSLPYVDPARIGVTGASGGGTQTMLLGAVDDRIAAAAPAVMVSHVYQGGCFCENAALLRLGTSNLEIAAMMAPKPMLMIGCLRDWTAHLHDEAFPMIRSIYGLYGTGDRLSVFTQDEEHNYNQLAREAAATFFGRVFLGREAPFAEQSFPMPDADRLLIRPGAWQEEPGARARVFAAWRSRVLGGARRLAASGDREGTLRRAMEVVIGAPDTNPAVVFRDDAQAGGIPVRRMTVSTAEGRFPMAVAGHGGENRVLLMVHPGGKAALARNPALRRRLLATVKQGMAVAMADVFLTGEYHAPYARAGRGYTAGGLTPQAFEWRDYFTCYNRTDDALRVQDIIAAARALMGLGYKVDVAAFGAASAWTAAALPWLSGVDEVSLCADALPGTDGALLTDFYVPGLGTTGGLAAYMDLSRAGRLRLRKHCSADETSL